MVHSWCYSIVPVTTIISISVNWGSIAIDAIANKIIIMTSMASHAVSIITLPEAVLLPMLYPLVSPYLYANVSNSSGATVIISSVTATTVRTITHGRCISLSLSVTMTVFFGCKRRERRLCALMLRLILVTF